MLSRKLLIAFASLSLLPLAHAEIYKTVDAQGHVTYTNQAPIGNDKKKAEQIEVHEGYSNKLPVTQTGSASYCGSIALPTRDVGSTSFFETVVYNEKTWRSEIARTQTLISQYNRNRRATSTPYNSDNLTKLAENQCAYDWVQDLRKNAKDERVALDRKSSGLNSYLQEMKSAQTSVCGEEPIYASSDRFFDDKRKSWQRCTADYQVKMRDIESDLKKTDAQLRDIHKIEISQ